MDIIEDCANFSKITKDLKPYIIEFKKDGIIKLKIYSNNCKVKGPNKYLIITMTYDKYIFSGNDYVQ